MWTTPHDWTNETVTATLMNLVRDDLGFLYSPPHCRVGGLGSSRQMTDTNGDPTWTMIDFPNTVADNDGMRTLTGSGQNEPATGLIETQTAGHYLASAVVAFAPIEYEDPTVGGTPPLLGQSQTLAAAIRASYTSASAYVGYASGGAGSMNDGDFSAIPVLAAYPCQAGYQWFIDFDAPKRAANMIVLRAGKIPYFYVTWIGGP